MFSRNPILKLTGFVQTSRHSRIRINYFSTGNNNKSHYLYSFGSGGAGQLGNARENLPTPKQVSFPRLKVNRTTANLPLRFTNISASAEHSLAVTESHGVYGWGNNNNYQAGIPSRSNYLYEPDFVSFFEPIPILCTSAGRSHSVFLSKSNEVFVCGVGEFGQLGTGLKHNEDKVHKRTKVPIRIDHLLSQKIVQVKSGLDHNLALTEDGQVFGWGWNIEGQLGLASQEEEVFTPKKVNSLSDKKVVKIDCGMDYSAFVTNTGELYTTGAADVGQLGIGIETGTVNEPKLVGALSAPVVDVACGGGHMLILTADGKLYGCGSNKDGGMGIGYGPQNFSTPIPLGEFTEKKIVKMSCGHEHSVVITEDGALWSWGRGDLGQLGHGSFDNEFVPRKIEFFDDKKVIDVKCGLSYTLVVTE